MDVTLNLSAGKSLQQRLDAPCKGDVAKALGKYKLEEKFGVTVRFESYQAGPGKAAQKLDDDAPVTRGAILNFTVDMELRQQVKHNKILAWLAAPKLIDTICLFNARLLDPTKVTSTVSPKTKLADKVATDGALHQALTAALSAVSAELSAEQVAAALDETYQKRNGGGCSVRSYSSLHKSQSVCSRSIDLFTEAGALFSAEETHINTNAVLQQKMEEMRESGALELLSSKYPVQCLIAQNYEVFLQLLH
jgi:hypothetical protein